MANPLLGEAELVAGEATYRLVLDINAICELEDLTNVGIAEFAVSFASGTSIRPVRAIVWAALQKHHPCSLAQAGEIVSEAGLEATAEIGAKLLSRVFPPAATGPKANPRTARKAGTG
jgi:hypothetical protein